jgi:hypothetical protein
MSEWLEYWKNRKLIEDIAVHKKIDKKMSLQDWEMYLNSLSHYAYLSQRIRNWYSFLMWLLIAVSFFSFFLNFYIFAISVILLIFVIFQRKKIHTFSQQKVIYTFVLPFIYYLRNEVWEETLLHLQIDLNPQIPTSSNDKIFTIEWLKGKTRLMDGSEIQFRFTDLRKKWYVAKRSISGKYKTKVKYKIVTKYKIFLTWDKRRYPKEIGEVPPKFKLKGKQKTKHMYTVFDPVAYSSCFTNAYQVLFKKVA